MSVSPNLTFIGSVVSYPLAIKVTIVPTEPRIGVSMEILAYISMLLYTFSPVVSPVAVTVVGPRTCVSMVKVVRNSPLLFAFTITIDDVVPKSI